MSRAEIEKLVKKRCSKQCNGQKTDEIGERQQKKLTGDAKKMKKSIRKIERRTRGWDIGGLGADTLCGGAGNDVLGGGLLYGGEGDGVRLRWCSHWENIGKRTAANDEITQTWRVVA